MEDPESGRPLKRFKHQSYEAALKTVHLTSASSHSKLDEDIPDAESHFRNALDQWRQLNLSAAFVRFAGQVQDLSANMSLLLHHLREVVSFWVEATKQSDDDALRALFDLLQKLVHDLRGTLMPFYTPLLETLLAFLTTPLSVETLTVHLATLSLFFKHLLIASPQLLAETWSSIISILPRCKPEVQRAVAEVWTTVLRRCKGEARETAVGLIMQDLENVADPCAWIFVYAFKSVSHTLHSCSSTLFETLLTSHLSPSNRTRTEKLMRRVITALIHHCDKAEQFAPISELLVTRLTTVSSPDEVPFMMDLVSVACSVRRGSRMTQKQLSTILSHLVSRKPPLLNLGRSVLTVASAALFAAEMPVWMGPGRKLVEVSWEEPSFGLELSGVLSALKWDAWRLIELPFTLKHTARLIDVHPTSTLHLLATLANAGRLDDVDETWLCKITTSLQIRLESWNLNEKKEELECILSLSPLLPSMTTGLVRLVNTILDESDKVSGSEVHHSTRVFSATIFGSCLKALSKTQNEEWTQQIDFRSWVIRAVRYWGWDDSAISGLVAISRRRGIAASSLSLTEILPLLQESVISHSHHLRRCVLELLTAPVVERTQSFSVMKRCLEGEEISLDVHGVRERALKINGASQALKDDDFIGADICARWLIAQLKINLRPLWAPAIKAIGVLAQRFGESVWTLVFTELERAVRGEPLEVSVPSTKNSSTEKETEHSWRDPSSSKLLLTVGRWSQGTVEWSNIPEAPLDRLDVANYELQLLHVLSEIAISTRKHNAEVIRLFLTFASPELPSKPSRKKLRNWLTLFSELDNPKAFHQSSLLLSLYRSLLSHSDRDLQSIALTCILNYKSPHLLPYATNFRTLLDNTRWRDELTTFDVAAIEETDRGEAVDTFVRLCFGLMLERHGRTRGADRRASLLGALGGCREEELKPLIDLMLEPLAPSSSSLDLAETLPPEVSERQQTGFLNLLGDVLKRMGSRLVPYWPSLLVTTIKLIMHAQTLMESMLDSAENPETEDVDGDEHSAHEAFQPLSKSRSMRTVRQLGIRRFTDFFRCEAAFDFGLYIPPAFSAFISPRLDALDRENTQSPSAILQLFHVWSMRRDFVHHLVDHDDRLLPKTYACLQSVNVKPTVVSLVFDIIENILTMSVDDSEVAERVLKPHISPILDALAVRLPTTLDPRSDLLHRQVRIVSQVAQFVSTASQAHRLLQHFLPLLKRPSKLIPEKTKVHLLKVIQGIIPVVPEIQEKSSVIYLQMYDLFAKLFQTLRGKPARIALLDTFNQLSIINTDLKHVSGLLASLNAFSTKRMDEPDFDRRIQAFTELNEVIYTQLSSFEWQPVLFNMLQFIQDSEELSIRTSAALSLKRFIDVLSSQGNQEFQALFIRILYPGLKNGLLSKFESVRNEIISVLAHGVLKCDEISSLNELRPLLASGDAEANFFNNVHHIQTHRRTRAMRRLIEYVDSGSVRNTTLSDIFVPLTGHFITNASTTDHILVDVAIIATGSMAKRLNWGEYNALVRHYLSVIKEKTLAERACVRALVAVLENFHFPMDDIVVGDEQPTEDKVEKTNENLIQSGNDMPVESRKHITGVPTKRIADAVNARLLPSLLQHLERRDDNEDALRIPVSIGIVQVARHLPTDAKEVQISRLLTILCQVFRSRSHETRTLTRDTLCKIAIILGPSYLHQIVTELRAALLRGPHLHVLATVVHAILVHVTSPAVVSSFNTLDTCAVDVAHVSAEVIFGQSGRDVHTEGFKTTMNEVRGSSTKGMDAFAILAQYVTPPKISAILSPIRGIMHETGASKTLQTVDDLLRRVSGGLNANVHLTPQEHLLLCYTLIQQNSRFLKESPRQVKRNGRAKGQFTVQTKRRFDQDDDHYAHNSFRFVAFGLDLFNTAFRRGKFDFKDPEIISRLEPMVSVIGNTLYSQDALVVTQGLKATAAIVKCPLKSVGQSLPIFVQQTLDIVRQAGNTDSEVVQSAFRTLAVIIRDCAASKVQEKDLVYLFEVLTPDLEEPNKQAAIFGLLRAIVSRKFVVAELYDIMDKVAEIMVTNQSAQVQELCRAVFLQFLLDYPQGKGRLRNQMTFLAQNLSYVYEGGRRSVMELLNAIFLKFETGLLCEYADLFFVALVMVIANDDSLRCREMAAQLIKSLFTHVDVTHRRTIVSHLHSWLAQKTLLQLSRVSVQVYGFVVDTLQQDITPHLSGLLEDINEVLRRSAAELEELESNENNVAMDVDVEWQLPYHSLNVISKVLKVNPELTTAAAKIDWLSIGSHLLFPHGWVRTAASRLLGVLYNASPPSASNLRTADNSLTSLSGLIAVARKSSLQLKGDTLDSSLSLQIVKNLFYIGRCFSCILKPEASKKSAVLTELGREEDDPGVVEEPGEEHDVREEDICYNPLSWLFSKLSYQARSAWIARRNRSVAQDNWSEQPIAIFRWFAAMSSHLESGVLEGFLVHILSPVYRVIDDDTVRDAQMSELRTLAHELVELLQNKVGTSKFADVYNQIRQGVVTVRQERKTMRAIQTAMNPRGAAKRKLKRNLAKKDRNTRKDRIFAERKIRNSITKKRT